MLARLSLLGLPGEASTHHYLTCLDGLTEAPNKVARKFEFSPLRQFYWTFPDLNLCFTSALPCRFRVGVGTGWA